MMMIGIGTPMSQRIAERMNCPCVMTLLKDLADDFVPDAGRRTKSPSSERSCSQIDAARSIRQDTPFATENPAMRSSRRDR
jgi:hypothetical protein